MDLEKVNIILLGKVINYRALFRKMVKIKNIDVYDKSGRCRFCNTICKSRALNNHDPLCIYVVAHAVPKHNKDLNKLVIKIKDKPTWFDRLIYSWIFNREFR